jgi:hypothetical protein
MGEIVNPGDRHGRVLPASEIALTWDGNALCALVGPDLVEGVPGFGDSVHDALRELAATLVHEAVWIEVPEHRKFDPTGLRSVRGGTIETNVVKLYRVDDDRVCAFVSADSCEGVFGIGYSVHEAVQDLADKFVSASVWIEVTPRTEWCVGIAASDEITLARAMCPRCGAVNTFPGFAEIQVFTCRECGNDVRLPPSQQP